MVFYNHLATLVCGVFSGVLVLLWYLFHNVILGGLAVLDVVFIMALPPMFFLTIICFVSQISTDYMHGQGHSQKPAKKLVYTSDGKATNEKS
jgi:ABC-type sulfate transport system permease subunit